MSDIRVELRPWAAGDQPTLETTVGDAAMMHYLGGAEAPDKVRARHARYLIANADVGRMFVILAYPRVDNESSNAVCRKAGFILLGARDFEYPPGHTMRCNDWVLLPRPPGNRAAAARR